MCSDELDIALMPPPDPVNVKGKRVMEIIDRKKLLDGTVT